VSLDLKQVTLESLSEIRYSFKTENHPAKPYAKRVLVIGFEGRCGNTPDATFMRSMGDAGVRAFNPHATIIDLSALTYEWGDEMASVFGIGGDAKPTAIVVGEKCRKAIESLCLFMNPKQDASRREWVFDTFDDAWWHVTKRLDEGATPPIHEAASSGDFQRVEQLLEAGEDPNRVDARGQAALHRASDPAIVKLLIDSGASVKAIDKCSWTPLHLVKNIECARLLLNAVADPDARSWENLSPLGHVQSVEIAKLLIEAGADVHLRRRSSLLHHRPTPDLAKLFIDTGVDVNCLDQAGHTPLDIAEASRRDRELVRFLRANGGKHGQKRKPVEGRDPKPRPD
jgi:hypothetical protein